MQDRVIDVPALIVLCAERGWTRRELARRSGVSYSMVKQVFRREQQFSDITALKVARALGCRPESFSIAKVADASPRRITRKGRAA